MLPQEIIRHKRDGGVLTPDELTFMARGLADGSVSEGQAAAFAMAVFFQGLDTDERVALTLAMRDSGQVLAWPELDGPVIDKHSTGGVGDCVSLILGPLVAACGGFVPMISGRGLGHTGGTLDKLEAIPGYNATPDEPLFRRAVAEAGVAIIGQTDELAPADRKLYAVRDVTATVESIDLITASILSKKLAAGLEALVMDVKTGNGAFMDLEEDARALAESIVQVARGAGVNTGALVTDMNQPLASSAGNALEVRESLAILSGQQLHGRLAEVTLALAGELLVLGKLARDEEEAHAQLANALASGRAAGHFEKMSHALGGPGSLAEIERSLPSAPHEEDVPAPEAGFLTAIDTRGVGLAVVELGGGRRKPEDTIDPSVGLSNLLPLGTEVEAGQPFARLHARSPEEASAAAARITSAFTISPEYSPTPPLVHGILR